MKKLILAGVLALGLSTAGTSVILEAAPCPNPNGWSGAQNMRASFDWGNALVRDENGVGVQPGGGMYQAMFGNGTGNGNVGMAGAIANTTGSCD